MGREAKEEQRKEQKKKKNEGNYQQKGSLMNGRRIFVNDIPNKELISKIYRELI